jgi:hypothetical protein
MNKVERMCKTAFVRSRTGMEVLWTAGVSAEMELGTSRIQVRSVTASASLIGQLAHRVDTETVRHTGPESPCDVVVLSRLEFGGVGGDGFRSRTRQ